MTPDLENLIKEYFHFKEELFEAQQKVQVASSHLLSIAVEHQVVSILKIDEAALHRYIKSRR